MARPTKAELDRRQRERVKHAAQKENRQLYAQIAHHELIERLADELPDLDAEDE